MFVISIMFVFTGCAVKSVQNTEMTEPEEPVEPKEPREPEELMEPAEGVMPEMPNVQIPEIPDVKMAVIPGLPDQNKMAIDRVVEAACGQCQLGITGKAGCDLAVRIDGKSYFVDGTSIHDHGDAHADDGFCEAIRQAAVKGEIVDGRFKAESFKLVE